MSSRGLAPGHGAGAATPLVGCTRPGPVSAAGCRQTVRIHDTYVKYGVRPRPICETLAALAEFTWDVQLPGEDLPRRLTTDYALSEGEQVTIDGLPWLVERVETDEAMPEISGLVYVVQPHEPAGL